MAAALVAAAACTPAGQLYEPVPVELGEPVAVEGDTVYRVVGRGYVLVAGRREALPDVKQALDLAAVRWRGFFGAEPPVATVLVRDSTTADIGERAVRGLGRGPFVALGAPAAERRMVTPGPAGPGPVQSPLRRAPAEPVVEAWIAAFADSVGGAGRRRGEAAAVPDWLEIGLVELVGGSGMPEIAAARLNRDPRLLSLQELFSSSQPAADQSSAGERDRRPRRRTLEDALQDPRERYALQSALVMQFLVERGGLTVPRRLLAALVRGRPMQEALGEAGVTPSDPGELEPEWRDWLADVGRPGR